MPESSFTMTYEKAKSLMLEATNLPLGGIAIAGTIDAEMDEAVVLEALGNKVW